MADEKMWVSQLDPNTLTPEQIDRLLFAGLEDKGDHGDCIIVLGSRRAMKNRVPKAVEAYRAGRAEKIMMCGGITSTTPGRTVSEADHMSLSAIEMGVPEEDILVENVSNNTIENILCSMIVLQRWKYLNRVWRVLLVTAPFHMQRSLHLARYFYPKHIEVCPCPACDGHATRQNWRDTPGGTETVIHEAQNLIMYVQNKVIPDFEI